MINIRNRKHVRHKLKFIFRNSSLIQRSIPSLSRFPSNLFDNSNMEIALGELSKLIFPLNSISKPTFMVRDYNIRSLKSMHRDRYITIEIYREDW